MNFTELAKAITDGKELQIHKPAHPARPTIWMSATHEQAMRARCRIGYWAVRIKPTLTPVNLQALVGSGIDCEMWDDRGDHPPAFGPLSSAAAGRFLRNKDDVGFRWCRPRMDYWHSCMELFEPIKRLEGAGFVVDESDSGESFRVTGVRAGRCMPWDVTK